VETSNIDRCTVAGCTLHNKNNKRATLQPATCNTRTVRDLLPEDLQGKIFPVGRLDKDSSGLLLFTNDGVLAYRLTHPKFDHEKEYEVTVDRSIPAMSLKHIERGIILKGKQTKPAKIIRVSPTTFRLILTEGRNRQIRRMCQDLGYTVKELKRVRIMTFQDAGLPSGAMRVLSTRERIALLRSVGLA
jgi:23S rRNA pseudouridine2605 synthase/23S rRNA pseudouridine2604 synthase